MSSEEIIRNLKVTSRYKGYALIIDAIDFVVENFNSDIKITKDIYPFLAEKYGTSKYSVERNIRTIVEIAWRSDKERVENILGYHINTFPSNGEFIECVAYYILKENGTK